MRKVVIRHCERIEVNRELSLFTWIASLDCSVYSYKSLNIRVWDNYISISNARFVLYGHRTLFKLVDLHKIFSINYWRENHIMNEFVQKLKTRKSEGKSIDEFAKDFAWAFTTVKKSKDDVILDYEAKIAPDGYQVKGGNPIPDPLKTGSAIGGGYEPLKKRSLIL